MDIRVLAVGKVKEHFYRTGIEHYLIRLKPYCNIKITEFIESRWKEKTKALREEGLAIDRYIRSGARIIVLAAEGRAMGSAEFARYMEKSLIEGKVKMDFIIGGPLGLSAKVKKRADLCLSLSTLTFPHRLARLILLEQLYRCFKIIRGEPYHK
ncbi:MAG: 23S rRNA (pseudouridine(1915)-N(3))-methyltransferase RlmH [Firmicutes bacterium]|nr:23S rRNA (pseudouridine(1915)-N(3))-methyltransferase RlmH [Bacillota bacterium]